MSFVNKCYRIIDAYENRMWDVAMDRKNAMIMGEVSENGHSGVYEQREQVLKTARKMLIGDEY